MTEKAFVTFRSTWWWSGEKVAMCVCSSHGKLFTAESTPSNLILFVAKLIQKLSSALSVSHSSPRLSTHSSPCLWKIQPENSPFESRWAILVALIITQCLVLKHLVGQLFNSTEPHLLITSLPSEISSSQCPESGSRSCSSLQMCTVIVGSFVYSFTFLHLEMKWNKCRQFSGLSSK